MIDIVYLIGEVRGGANQSEIYVYCIAASSHVCLISFLGGCLGKIACFSFLDCVSVCGKVS